MAARTLRAYVQAAVGEREAVSGVIVCVQTFGSVAHLHPHLHVLMTDGAFRRDGTFVPLPVPEPRCWRRRWQGTGISYDLRGRHVLRARVSGRAGRMVGRGWAEPPRVPACALMGGTVLVPPSTGSPAKTASQGL